MTDYIRAVKRGLRDKYGFQPLPGGTKEDPTLSVPDGEYPMKIEGKIDHVVIKDGHIHCCNFKKSKRKSKAKRRGRATTKS